ncbi:GNAT family N-acetyltransferase [Fluviispira sanaruensis]|uniref:Hemolysin n=1 Tax=Fluviispira sanaruensis TaxID=2493639 RepID=A0A4P2VPG6_FLUSA|nr:GNAT family N-acyltransferase [Fluviispira sanaruensis]BBH54144.1 hypothetical protein JCM31447_26020 [Fluviispira sanaruensis]
MEFDKKKLSDKFSEFFEENLSNYSPYLNIEIKTEKYTLSTANSQKDLIDIFKLRYMVFYKENGIISNINFDIDEFDSVCDHLIIRSNSTNDICGTYRIITNDKSPKFYSSTEFELSDFHKINGKKLELGRACINPIHRNSTLKDLLWKGIILYSHKIKADIIFGCSSVYTNSFAVAHGLLDLFKEKNVYSADLIVAPLEHYRLQKIVDEEKFDRTHYQNYLPPLLRGYILAGAKVYGEPAMDKSFKCIDFFTMLYLKDLTPLFKNRYMRNL